MSYSSEYLTRKEVNHNLGTQELKKTKDLSGKYNTLKGKFPLNRLIVGLSIGRIPEYE